MIDIIHTTAFSFFFYSLLSLLFGANKQDVATFSYYLPNEIADAVIEGKTSEAVIPIEEEEKGLEEVEVIETTEPIIFTPGDE
ncbi:unnamed protein product [marine sediment metagenome]|uniref:Uncharacterized protein n=1 Tax=marine sediment metagenome TaxID=412755 RepID=X1BWJ6_9ZZZZ